MAPRDTAATRGMRVSPWGWRAGVQVRTVRRGKDGKTQTPGSFCRLLPAGQPTPLPGGLQLLSWAGGSSELLRVNIQEAAFRLTCPAPQLLWAFPFALHTGDRSFRLQPGYLPRASVFPQASLKLNFPDSPWKLGIQASSRSIHSAIPCSTFTSLLLLFFFWFSVCG